MKNLNPKIFWTAFLFVVSIVGGLIFIVIGLMWAMIFWVGLIIGMIIFWPFLPHMPIVLNFFEREYEFECNVLRVLRMAKFDNAIKDGWMAPIEILFAVDEISDRRSDIIGVRFVLGRLRRKGAIVSKIVPVEYLKNPPKRSRDHGFRLAFKLEDDSDYRPRKPKWLSKKQKKEKKEIHDGVVVHS